MANRKRLILIIIATFFISIKVHSQTAVPWLLIQSSPELNGMAGAYTALPTDDPYGSYYNPAQIGNFGRNVNFSTHFYLKDVTWLPQFNFSSLTYNNLGIGLGYNIQNIYPKVPLSIGLGYIRTRFELQDNVVTDENGNMLGTFSSLETADAFTIGLTLDYVLLFSLGYSYKHIDSQLFDESPQVGAERRGGHSTANAGDFGMQLVFPVINIYEFFSEQKISIEENYQPVLDLSFGYALCNIGDGMSYIDEAWDIPLPRQTRLGYSITVGMDKMTHDMILNLFSFSWSSEARDLLVQWDASGYNYQTSPGDIKFWDNVILGKSDENIQIHQGWNVQLFETVTYSRGKFQFLYQNQFQETWGLVISTKGLFKYLSTPGGDSTFDFISKYLELRYSQSSLVSDHESASDGTFHGLALYIFGF